MAGRADAPQRVFKERRQAYGWLAFYWSTYVMMVIVLPQSAYVMWTGEAPPTPVVGIGFAFIVVLFGVWIWGLRARRGVSTKEARALGKEHDVGPWGMSTFIVACAAKRIGRSPTLAAWINRVLITIQNVLVVVVAVLLFRTLVG